MCVAANSTTEANDLRYQLLCAKRGEIESSLLSPRIDCLFMHLLRANCHAAIWKCCLYARPTVPDPTKCGCKDDDDKLAIHWMRSPPAPDAVGLGIVGLQVCPFLYAVNVYVHGKWTGMHRHVQVSVMQLP